MPIFENKEEFKVQSSHLKKLEKEVQTKPKLSRRKLKPKAMI